MQNFAETTFIGNLGKDPKVTTIASGSKVANFTLAVNEAYKDKNSNEWKNSTHWFDLFTWSPGQIGFIERNLRQGDTVLIKASPEMKTWDDRGANRQKVEFRIKEIRILEKKANRADTGEARGRQQQAPQESYSAELDSEYPF